MLEVLEFAVERIVVAVADLRAGLDVVEVVVVADEASEFFDAAERSGRLKFPLPMGKIRG